MATFQVREVNEVLIVSATGSLVSANSFRGNPAFGTILDELFTRRGHDRDVLLELSGISEMNSEALWAIADEWTNRADKTDALMVWCPSEAAAQAITKSRIGYRMWDSEAAAFEYCAVRRIAA